MARWKYMPILIMLVVAAGCVAEVFWMNYRNWYLE
jgi:hypothetical protein